MFDLTSLPYHPASNGSCADHLERLQKLPDDGIVDRLA